MLFRSNDIEQATRLARAMVTRYGMGEEFGMTALETVAGQYLGGDASLSCSPQTAARIDEVVMGLIKNARRTAMDILTKNRQKLDELAAYLLREETITGEQFMQVLQGEESSDI